MTESAAPSFGIIGGASARGASHIARGKPNQDARGGFALGPWTVIVVSDGHGSDPHFRSDRGSQFAVEAVRAAFAEFTKQGALGAADAAKLKKALPLLPSVILQGWRAAVRADVAADPDPGIVVDDPFTVYGATCVAAAFAPGISVFVQLGDGDILAAAADSDIVKPLADDEGLEGEQTYSLCLDDAKEHFRTALFSGDHPLAVPRFVMTSTDGLAKSFSQDDHFLAVGRQWRGEVEGGSVDAVCTDLEDWLSHVSENGSGDDTTVMLFHNRASPAVSAPMPQVAAKVAMAPSAASSAGEASARAPASDAPPARRGFRLILAVLAGAALGAGAVYYALSARGGGAGGTEEKPTKELSTPATGEPAKPGKPVNVPMPNMPVPGAK